jgi:hypothetical protein
VADRHEGAVRVFARLQGDDASRVGGERDFAQHKSVRPCALKSSIQRPAPERERERECLPPSKWPTDVAIELPPRRCLGRIDLHIHGLLERVEALTIFFRERRVRLPVP